MNEPSPDNNTLADRSTSMVDKELIQDTLSPEKRCPECDNGQYCGVGPCPKCHPEAYVTSNDLLTKLRWIGSIAAFKEPDIARACADAAGEIERLTRRLAMSDAAGKLALTERDRLRALVQRAHAIISIREAAHETHKGRAWLEQATRELNGETTSAHETKAKPEALTRSEVVVEILDVIDDLIKPGDLNGNGTDETAYRNGLVTAYNVISAQFGEFAQKAGEKP